MVKEPESPYEGPLYIAQSPEDGSYVMVSEFLDEYERGRSLIPDYTMDLSALPIELPRHPGSDSARLDERLPDRPPHKVAKVVGLVALASVLAIASRYTHNVVDGKQHNQLAAPPSISHVFDPEQSEVDPLAGETIIFDFPGLTGNDAYPDTIHMTSYQKHGQVEAMKYGETIDIGKMADLIIAKAEAEGKTRIALSGRSMGGIVALEVAAEIYKRKTKLQIAYIVLDCSPSSVASVRPERLTLADKIAFGLSIIPGAYDSSDLNFAGQYAAELAGHPQNAVKGTIFERIIKAGDKYLDVNSGSKASVSLILAEYGKLASSDVPGSMETLGNTEGKQKPIVVLIQPENPAADSTIDSEKSAAEYREFSLRTGVLVVVVRVPGITHANPGFTPGEWNAGAEGKVFPAIYGAERTRDIIQALKVYQAWVKDYRATKQAEEHANAQQLAGAAPEVTVLPVPPKAAPGG